MVILLTETDVTSVLKSRMKQREGQGASVNVAARASFFVDEQKRAGETIPANKLDRHPSAKIQPVDKTDTEVSVGPPTCI